MPMDRKTKTLASPSASSNRPLFPVIPPITVAPIHREFPFTEQDFEAIRVFIYNKAGIALNPAKKDMVYGRLVRRVRDLKMGDFASYIQYLQSANGHKELETFVNALTTNLTFFFREEHHFPLLAEHARARMPGDFKVWCSAASTGEEPYSIAMTLLEAGAPAAKIMILATDLDTQVLKIAANGIYSADKVSKVPANLQRKYFTLQPSGDYQVAPVLRQCIHFQPLNLVSPNWQIREQFDAIFCRNVMIYFDRPTQYEVLKKFRPHLKPDGLLFVGHSENLYHATDLFQLRGKTVYQLVKK